MSPTVQGDDQLSPQPEPEPAAASAPPPPQPPALTERRGDERRERPTPMVSRYTFFGGRRRGDRRGWGSSNQYVDVYEPGLAAVLITVAVLCALDAVFTLLYLQRGGEEANPVMAEVIRWGPRTFIAIKCSITNLGLLVLCMHKNFRYVRSVIGTIFAIYGLLFLYHLFLVVTVT